MIYNLLYNKKSYTPSEGYIISGFHHKGDENCALLGYYAASRGNSLTNGLGQPIMTYKNANRKAHK